MTLYEQRLKRTLDAVQMKPVDKIPFSYGGPAYVAKCENVKMSEYVSDFKKATDTVVSFAKNHPGIDSMHGPVISPYGLSTLWLSQVKVPGVELPDDELWQIDEQELMKFEDYEKIIKMGYGPWVENFMKNNLGDPVSKMKPFLDYNPESFRRVAEEGQVPIVNGFMVGTPFEGFCGGRQLMKFFIDLVEEPELVKEALDKAMDYIYADFVARLDSIKPIGVWVGGWRAAPELLAHDTWMEFVWPYLRKFIDATLERNVLPILHFDSCWDSELETLKELPPKKCLLMLDGSTDMRKAREVLDDRMCLIGDVPSTMLAFGTENEVYNYVTKLIDDVGPKTGLMISSGCDAPMNAKHENVNAMIQATIDYPIR